MARFEKVSAPPTDLRNVYLDSLAEPQELFVELQVSDGVTWSLDGIAYAVVHGERLVEFFVAQEDARRICALFEAVMSESGASSVLCKSFDTQLLYAALSKAAKVSTTGLLFRRITDPRFLSNEETSFRIASVSDAEAVLGFNDGFFQDVDEVVSYAEGNGLFLLEKNEEIIGCGIGKPVIHSRPDIDIGMLVAPEHRRLGFGSLIVAFLKDHYLRLGLRPICGCSSENVGSSRALNNAGFVSEHRLLEISYSPNEKFGSAGEASSV